MLPIDVQIAILTHFKKWSGGFHPARSNQVKKYIDEQAWFKDSDLIGASPVAVAEFIRKEEKLPELVVSIRELQTEIPSIQNGGAMDTPDLEKFEFIISRVKAQYEVIEDLKRSGEGMRGWLANGTIWMGGLSDAIRMTKMGFPTLGLDRYDLAESAMFLRWVQVANGRLGNWEKTAGNTYKYSPPLLEDENLHEVGRKEREIINRERSNRAIYLINEKMTKADSATQRRIKDSIERDDRVEPISCKSVEEMEYDTIIFRLTEHTALFSNKWHEIWKEVLQEGKAFSC